MTRRTGILCPSCGAPLGGRDGCQAYFDGLSARAWEHPLRGEMHNLVVDAYALQHPEEYCASGKSYAAHLTGLCCGIEHPGDRKLYWQIPRWLDGPSTIVKPPVLEARGRKNISTIADVRDDAYQTAVRQWASAVWTAYESQHYLARGWLAEVLRRDPRKALTADANGTETRALVFDLAGVLLDFGGPEYVYEKSGGRVDEEAYFRFWSEAKCAHDLHCGRISPEEFARDAVRVFGLNITPESFLTDYRTWFRGPYDGALELIESMRPRYQVACLSNANVLDVKRFGDELQLHRRFDACFYSNELGLRKPDPAAYLHVSRTLGIPTRQMAFFDDSQENVDAAAALGMDAHRVAGFDDLQRRLRRLHFL